MNDGEQTARVQQLVYRPYQGPLESLGGRFRVVAAHQLRLSLKDRWFRRLLLGSFFPLGVFAVIVVVQSRISQALGRVLDLWQPFWGIQLFFALALTYLCGRASIGEDLRTGAATVYFTRPLTRAGYLWGKWLGVALPVMVVTLGPALLLATFRLLVEPAATAALFLRWLAAAALASLLVAATMGWVMLGLSALTRRARAAGFLWIGVVVGGSALAGGLAETLDDSLWRALSFTEGSAHLFSFLAEGRVGWAEGAMGAVGMVAWALLGWMVLRLRLAAARDWE